MNTEIIERVNKFRHSKLRLLVFQINIQIFSFTLCLTETPLRSPFWKALGPTNLLKVVTSLFKEKLPQELLEGSHTACFQWMIYAFETEQDSFVSFSATKAKSFN